MIKRITNFLIIFFIFQQLESQISKIDQNGVNSFCDETLHIVRQEKKKKIMCLSCLCITIIALPFRTPTNYFVVSLFLLILFVY